MTRLTARERELAETQVALVEQLVGSMFRTSAPSLAYSRDDARSDGWLALTRASQDYRAGRGASFRTFATRRIRGAVLDGLRRTDVATRDQRHAIKQNETHLRGREIVVPSFASLDAPGAAALVANIPTPEAVEREVLAGGLRVLVDQLPRREAYIVGRVFYDDATQAVVAGELGVHPSRISQLLAGACSTLHGPLSELKEAC